ncbi:hypothetical protein KFE25_000398 [Diacronema lutheri]|uniref:F-box domain-containing protein n=1 Tax=Diacronema lutheri TaxID=2081491 RepID=A0A8J5XQV4_DIALT|nr:hypothetical protein KFE25_000398 [Diacronema lutheri]
MVKYGDTRWRPPSGASLAPCLFWVVPDVHHGFPSPWSFWVSSGLIAETWSRGADEMILLRRCVDWLDLRTLAAAARVCRAWRRVVYCSSNAWLRLYRSNERALDLPPLRADSSGCAVRAALAAERGGCFHARSALRDILRARQLARAALVADAARKAGRSGGAAGAADALRAAPADTPPSEEVLGAVERALGEWLPVAVREGVKQGALGVLVSRLLGEPWRARLWPCDRWSCAHARGVLPPTWRRLGPMRPPRRPVAIGTARAEASAGHAARQRLLVLFNGELFAAALMAGSGMSMGAERHLVVGDADAASCGSQARAHMDGSVETPPRVPAPADVAPNPALVGPDAAASGDEGACVAYGSLLDLSG